MSLSGDEFEMNERQRFIMWKWIFETTETSNWSDVMKCLLNNKTLMVFRSLYLGEHAIWLVREEEHKEVNLEGARSDKKASLGSAKCLSLLTVNNVHPSAWLSRAPCTPRYSVFLGPYRGITRHCELLDYNQGLLCLVAQPAKFRESDHVSFERRRHWLLCVRSSAFVDGIDGRRICQPRLGWREWVQWLWLPTWTVSSGCTMIGNRRWPHHRVINWFVSGYQSIWQYNQRSDFITQRNYHDDEQVCHNL